MRAAEPIVGERRAVRVAPKQTPRQDVDAQHAFGPRDLGDAAGRARGEVDVERRNDARFVVQDGVGAFTKPAGGDPLVIRLPPSAHPEYRLDDLARQMGLEGAAVEFPADDAE